VKKKINGRLAVIDASLHTIHAGNGLAGNDKRLSTKSKRTVHECFWGYNRTMKGTIGTAQHVWFEAIFKSSLTYTMKCFPFSPQISS
jgi:hypothetical protein